MSVADNAYSIPGMTMFLPGIKIPGTALLAKTTDAALTLNALATAERVFSEWLGKM
ncbi:hypothetical protein D3C85_1770250 [compost metagenome]